MYVPLMFGFVALSVAVFFPLFVIGRIPTKEPMRRWTKLTSLVAGALLAAGVLVGSALGGSRSNTLESAVLRPDQIGPGYVRKTIPGGDVVQGQVTLDMCGFRFRSERMRLGRLQVAYAHRGRTLSLSNEVVRYQRGGAAFAMSEIARAISTCPRRPVPSAVQGVPDLTYRMQRLSTAGHSLLSAAIVMKVSASGTLNGKRFSDNSIVVYERRGEMLSGIYVYGGSLSTRRALALRCAEGSAENLRAR